MIFTFSIKLHTGSEFSTKTEYKQMFLIDKKKCLEFAKFSLRKSIVFKMNFFLVFMQIFGHNLRLIFQFKLIKILTEKFDEFCCF